MTQDQGKERKKERNHSFTVDTDRYVCGKENETRQEKRKKKVPERTRQDVYNMTRPNFF